VGLVDEVGQTGGVTHLEYRVLRQRVSGGRGRAPPSPQAPVARSGAVETSRIATLPVFAQVPAAEVDELAGAMRELEVDAGTNVVTADDYGSAIYFVEEGEADVVTDSGDAPQGLGPGDAFGEIALFLTGERTATVTARTPMRLLTLSGPDFERIRERVPEAERRLRRLGIERAGR
jgi:CRP-like cAMP-binding protein